MTLRKTCARISKAVGMISNIFLICGIIAVCVIALVSSVDSIGRYIFGSALRGASEYVETMMAVFVYGGLAMAIRERKCVVVPVFLERMSPRVRLFFVGVGNLCCGLAGVLVCSQVWLSASRNMSNFAYATEVVKIPYGPFYLFAFLGLCLVTVELFLLAIQDLYEGICYRKLHGQDGGLPAEQDQQSEEGGDGV